MNNLEKLHDLAHREKVAIISTSLEADKSMIISDGENTVIALDKKKMESKEEEYVRLMHELGHHQTDSFYRANSTRDQRRTAEYRAKRWQYENFLTLEDIQAVVDRGVLENFEIAEELGVTAEMIVDAVLYWESRGKRIRRNYY